MAAQGIIDMEEVIKHFMRVNDCSRDDFSAHREEAIANWRARSEHERWELDWGLYQHLIDEHGVT